MDSLEVIMVKPPAVSIFDPRAAQDFRASNSYTGETLSSLTENLFVADCVGEVNWTAHLPLVRELIISTSALAFFALTPWFPGARGLRRQLAAHFKMSEPRKGLLVSYFSPDAEQLGKIFDARQRHGGASGEILVGGCTEPLDLSGIGKPGAGEPWSLVISQRSRLGCFLYLGELQRSTLIVRMDSGIDHLIDELAARLIQAPGP